MVFGGGLGTINGSNGCVQKDIQVWDGKTYLQLGPSQSLSTGAEVQLLLVVMGSTANFGRQSRAPLPPPA